METLKSVCNPLAGEILFKVNCMQSVFSSLTSWNSVAASGILGLIFAQGFYLELNQKYCVRFYSETFLLHIQNPQIVICAVLVYMLIHAMDYVVFLQLYSIELLQIYYDHQL